jgi:predicted dehydrogenase
MPAGAGTEGFLGAGGYAGKVLIPAFRAAGAGLHTIASSGGVNAAELGRKFGFGAATTDVESVLSNGGIDTVVIATRHDSHADLICRALEAGKHVFVEKPLAMRVEEIDRIEGVYRGLSRKPLLMVGFNRRFAPQVVRARQLLAGVRGPKSFIYTVNAGSIPAGHWTVDPESGGGRIVGEACHFLDLLRHLAGCRASATRTSRVDDQTVTITVEYEDGSAGTVHYFANGHKMFPKERLEIFAGGRILQLDNFRVLRGFGWPGFGTMRLWRQDKGAVACAAAFVRAVRNGGPAPIDFAELMEVARTTCEVADASGEA